MDTFHMLQLLRNLTIRAIHANVCHHRDYVATAHYDATQQPIGSACNRFLTNTEEPDRPGSPLSIISDFYEIREPLGSGSSTNINVEDRLAYSRSATISDDNTSQDTMASRYIGKSYSDSGNSYSSVKSRSTRSQSSSPYLPRPFDVIRDDSQVFQVLNGTSTSSDSHRAVLEPWVRVPGSRYDLCSRQPSLNIESALSQAMDDEIFDQRELH
ncbi:uncharacterized protein JN550_013100 [Neoarthrinium moseri]|uniref:uncharacterized protein n=1 Tax=Neoarthrinium moseri TaxID=1658444 RepID=UPI001FDB6930|nr:uncharacterized protein JN550_013100 [Neoarthrinium moseri]KAI1857764.1 hypothetical protein JN550_013100 [Neoarthrinium moseri]